VRFRAPAQWALAVRVGALAKKRDTVDRLEAVQVYFAKFIPRRNEENS
jgi:hypothetical protein